MLLGLPHHKSNSYLSQCTRNISVSVEMSVLLLLHLLLYNVSSPNQSMLEDIDLEKTKYKSEKLNNVIENEEELMQRMEIMESSWKMEKVNLEKKLETKNVEVENLQQELKEVKVQFAEIKSKMEDLMLKIQKNQEIDNLKSEIRAEVKKDLVTAVEKGLSDLPYEMVCAYKERWTRSNSVVSYDRITMHSVLKVLKNHRSWR